MNEKTVTVEFEANHLRNGYVRIVHNSSCDFCKKKVPILEMDTSNGEYGIVEICKNCIEYLFTVAGEK